MMAKGLGIASLHPYIFSAAKRDLVIPPGEFVKHRVSLLMFLSLLSNTPSRSYPRVMDVTPINPCLSA
jgi:hypothetical protein